MKPFLNDMRDSLLRDGVSEDDAQKAINAVADLQNLVIFRPEPTR